MSDRGLFDLDTFTVAVPIEERVKLSADRRRTIRNAEALERGEHPTTRRPVRADLGTCGDCAHHLVTNDCAKRYHKCRFTQTRGASSDIRVSWPACDRFDADDGFPWDDAYADYSGRR